MKAAPADWLRPGWAADGVGALMTTRRGGCSAAPFATMNLRDGIGDDPVAVARNAALLAAVIGSRPLGLNQVHGSHVVRVDMADAAPDAPRHDADASVTTTPGLALAVQVADCLPVLFAAPAARAIGAAHAGWRGLAAGILEATLHAVCEAASCEPVEVQAWLGASIGPRRFEVGADVLAAFGVEAAGAAVPGFAPTGGLGKWLADLPGLARRRLRQVGVERIDGGDWCTVSDSSRFFSFRRDGVTGRMAACIWIEPRRGG